jgi:Fe-S oxidoreductase
MEVKIANISGFKSFKSLFGISMLLFKMGSKGIYDLNPKQWDASDDLKSKVLETTAAFDAFLEMEMIRFRSRCRKCDLCAKDCAFLREYGPPSNLVKQFDFSRPDYQKLAFECSLCGLCATICPEKLNFANLFLLVRRKAILEKNIDLAVFSKILNYERFGASPLFSYYGLPDGCNTIYFPGCTFPGKLPEVAWRVFKHLQSHIPCLGVVLDCCAKPSHDLGRQNYFEKAFKKIALRLKNSNIENVIVNCPNCFETFKTYGTDFKVETVYEFIDQNINSQRKNLYGRTYTIHDPCVLREENGIHSAVRNILKNRGASIQEMPHAKKKASCCGEGGSVGFTNPNFSKSWTELRKNESHNIPMLTYCAGCADALAQRIHTTHLLEILFAPAEGIKPNNNASNPPWTYLNRLRLKHRLQMSLSSQRNL